MSTTNRRLRQLNDQDPIGWIEILFMVIVAIICLAVKYGPKIDAIL